MYARTNTRSQAPAPTHTQARALKHSRAGHTHTHAHPHAHAHTCGERLYGGHAPPRAMRSRSDSTPVAACAQQQQQPSLITLPPGHGSTPPPMRPMHGRACAHEHSQYCGRFWFRVHVTYDTPDTLRQSQDAGAA